MSAVATHKLSRLITKDPVTSPLRAPFTVYQGQEGPAELEEEVRGQGARKAVGELITCPFCIDMWVATGLMAGFIYLPRATRLAIDTLAVLAGADLVSGMLGERGLVDWPRQSWNRIEGESQRQSLRVREASR